MLTVKFDPHLCVEEMMLLEIHPNLVEITFGVCMAVLWNSNKVWLYCHMNLFPVHTVLLLSGKKKIFECCIPLNNFLLI